MKRIGLALSMGLFYTEKDLTFMNSTTITRRLLLACLTLALVGCVCLGLSALAYAAIVVAG
jgi:hypothetical protein